jgi:hypothetical protein
METTRIEEKILGKNDALAATNKQRVFAWVSRESGKTSCSSARCRDYLRVCASAWLKAISKPNATARVLPRFATVTQLSRIC